MPLAEAGLPERVLAVLTEADFENAGQVLEKLALDEDRILRLEGMGPKVLEEIKEKLSSLAVVEPEAPVAVEAETQPVPEAAAEVEAPAVEIESASEAVAEPVAEAPAELAPAAPAPEGEAGPDVGMKDIEAYLDVAAADEEEEDLPGDKKKKKGKGKGKRVEMVFDEDLGVMVAKRKRKLGRTSVWDEATGVE
ncbi:MAG: hypothetical protein HY023_15960 [Chloroflexi bacterium]|nr:hypothetical protein [Chloroflexota bacterium]